MSPRSPAEMTLPMAQGLANAVTAASAARAFQEACRGCHFRHPWRSHRNGRREAPRKDQRDRIGDPCGDAVGRVQAGVEGVAPATTQALAKGFRLTEKCVIDGAKISIDRIQGVVGWTKEIVKLIEYPTI